HSQKRGYSASAVFHSAVPLIVVGNITAGGTGKTPLVIGLCEIAIKMNLKPGIASTGYGRRSRDTLVVEADSDTRTCGDEPVLLALRTGVPVIVASKRREAVQRLNELKLDLIISDDGLQQADLQRDIEFCVIDGERGIGNAYLIPAGPLRESPERLRQVDHVVTNGQWNAKPDDVDVSEMRLKASVVRSIDGGTEYEAKEFRQRHTGIRLHAVAGIGNPVRFFSMLDGMGFDVESHVFPDHHNYTNDDFDSLAGNSAIIMTEKDAVKCRSLKLENAWYVPVDTHLSSKFEDTFREQLTKLVKQRT
ncbi:MAG: tetraacyldisaccharide 4'-kinase, partial [Gammaproteobacteria bacterium]|nr:tetraacyldisaccharide 4'-kinase [Gammaproteobacteria bacterium]